MVNRPGSARAKCTYSRTANPHHLSVENNNGQDTLAGLRSIGTDTQSYKDRAPQFDTPTTSTT